MEACNTIDSCADVGFTCACCLVELTLLVAASGAIFRLSAARSIVFFLRLAGRATYRSVLPGPTAG